MANAKLRAGIRKVGEIPGGGLPPCGDLRAALMAFSESKYSGATRWIPLGLAGAATVPVLMSCFIRPGIFLASGKWAEE